MGSISIFKTKIVIFNFNKKVITVAMKPLTNQKDIVYIYTYIHSSPYILAASFGIYTYINTYTYLLTYLLTYFHILTF